MKDQRAWMLPVLTFAAVVSAAINLEAQSYPPYAPGPGYPAMAAAPAGYPPAGPAMGPVQYAAPQMYPPEMYPAAFPGSPGPQGVSLAGYCEPGGAACMPGGMCMACGGQGCNQCGCCPPDFDLRLLGLLLPYSEGGCCAQRWYDISADFLLLKRDNLSRYVPFMSDKIAGLGEPNIVLSTDDLEFDVAPGLRITAALQFTAHCNLEFTYMGAMSWTSHASIVDPTDGLFSVFSKFGTDPPPQTTPPPPAPPSNITLGGFDDTDAAQFASISYESRFDSIELNTRKRWVDPNCRLQGSHFGGLRYMIVDERFIHNIRTDHPDPNDPLNHFADIRGGLDYRVDTFNGLFGVQAGGDLWACLCPGLMFGSEVKGGVFWNHAVAGTQSWARDAQILTLEKATSDDVSVMLEATFQMLYRISYSWTAKGGYEVVWIDGVALAPENFNPIPPTSSEREVFINDNGYVFYHGLTMGLEYMW